MRELISSRNDISSQNINTSHSFFTICGYITNPPHDQLPVGLIAQLVEHCTGIADVMGSNPVQAWIFFIRLYFHKLIKHMMIIHICIWLYNFTLWLYLFYIGTDITLYKGRDVHLQLLTNQEDALSSVHVWAKNTFFPQCFSFLRLTDGSWLTNR